MNIRALLSHRFVRYLIVGGSAYVVEMMSLYYLHSVLKLSPVKSAAISFWIGFVVAFVLQKIVTFRDFQKHRSALVRQIAGYSALVIWNYAFTLVMVRLLTTHTSVFVVRTLTIAIITSWNFLIYQKIFADRGTNA